ncbi:LOW QUALITY PROTEIN: hypothetical protein BC938DRAFT_482898 [Jimgerdemannia flammicorona]|uniref:Uncharacterized protein n=1 Tax=Jimgerdemannia flammicorona TaxID=994334 RepID=A0A433QD55_9FUNG|nr:LOW QUALITY PROTEIN: hypothetical protein BC938DRAFT_482898 [Jimgerdemannia flammicorona]
MPRSTPALSAALTAPVPLAVPLPPLSTVDHAFIDRAVASLTALAGTAPGTATSPLALPPPASAAPPAGAAPSRRPEPSGRVSLPTFPCRRSGCQPIRQVLSCRLHFTRSSLSSHWMTTGCAWPLGSLLPCQRLARPSSLPGGLVNVLRHPALRVSRHDGAYLVAGLHYLYPEGLSVSLRSPPGPRTSDLPCFQRIPYDGP